MVFSDEQFRQTNDPVITSEAEKPSVKLSPTNQPCLSTGAFAKADRSIQVRLKIPITSSQYVGLEKPTNEFNEWKYRAADLQLSLKHFEVAAEDFPVFWQEFLGRKRSLQVDLKPHFLDALREVEIEEFGVTLKKVMKTLDDFE